MSSLKRGVVIFAKIGLMVAMVALNGHTAVATNYPCSKSKGGVERCQGSKFVCRDGSVSASKKKCTPESAERFRQEWEADNGGSGDEPADTEQPAQSEEDDQGYNGSSSLLSLVSMPEAGRIRVIDGDTIEVGNETFRLEGIDAPEMKQTCVDSAGKEFPCGRRAKAILSGLITQPVSCRKSGEDKYGRSLGYCTASDVDLNREMVAQGWAMAFIKYNSRYVADERAARLAKLGLWSGGEFQPPWDWRASQIAALAPKGECVIKGNISHGFRVYYLPFHSIYSRVKVDEASGERWFCSEADAIAAGWYRAAR